MTGRNDDRPVDSACYEEFLRLFLRDQFRVLAYIRAQIPDRTAANDVWITARRAGSRRSR